MADTFHFALDADAPVILGALHNGRDDPPDSGAYQGETEKNALRSDGELVQAVSDKIKPTQDDPFAGLLVDLDF